jgi:hypothetical protein
MINIKHSGNIGDIVLSLCTVLQISIKHNDKINYYLDLNGNVGSYLPLDRANSLIPLLKSQEYINDVFFFDNMTKIDYNLDNFRNFVKYDGSITLSQAHLKANGFNDIDENEKHLFINEQSDILYDIVCSRTDRYNNPNFDWNNILNDYKNMSMCFIGYKYEYDIFISKIDMKHKIDYIFTKDLYEVAKIINSSKVFIGNQSSCFAIAQTMRKNIILESLPSINTCNYITPNIKIIK